jgi:hypothetical protein
MAETVYLLCAVTSIACAVLLYRGYRRTRAGLLFWSSLCFSGLAANNILLFVDLVVVQGIDLSLARGLIALAGLMAMVFGLAWESSAA